MEDQVIHLQNIQEAKFDRIVVIIFVKIASFCLGA